MTSNSAHEHQLSSHRLFTVTMFNPEVSALKEIICRFLLHLLRYIFFLDMADDFVRSLIREALRGHKRENVVKVFDGDSFFIFIDLCNVFLN